MSPTGYAALFLTRPVHNFAAYLVVATASLLPREAGWVAGLAAYYPLHHIVATAQFLAGWPLASIDPGRVDARFATLAGGFFVLAGWPCYRFPPPDLPRGRHPRGVRTVRAALAAATAAGVIASVMTLAILPLRGPGDLRLVVLDVGQGDAILVVTPGGHEVLIDGGPSGRQLMQQIGHVLPHWDRTIDAVVVTHAQEDHVAGLRRLEQVYRVGRLLDSGNEGTNMNFSALISAADGRRAVIAAGSAFEVDGVSFQVLWPPPDIVSDDVNNSSVVIRVMYEGRDVLLTGDIEGSALAQLAETESLRAEVLKVPHHGSATTPAWFFSRVSSKLALISVGAKNRFGHPSPATLEALAGVPVLRTDEVGRVTVDLDGHSIRAWTERGGSYVLPVD